MSIGVKSDEESALLARVESRPRGGMDFAVRGSEGNFDGAGIWAEDLEAIVEGFAGGDLLGSKARVRVIDLNEADGGSSAVGDGGFDVRRMAGREGEAEENGGKGCESFDRHRDSLEPICVSGPGRSVIRHQTEKFRCCFSVPECAR